MSTITTIAASDYQDDSRAVINTNFDNLNTDKLEKSGGTMTGALAFSGTTNAGLKVNNLTTAQRNALTAAVGMIIYNTTLSCFEKYANGAWVPMAAAPSMTTTVRDTLSAVNGMQIYNTTSSKFQIYQAGTWIDFVTTKFGGDGTDGALTVTSGTTTIDLGSAAIVVKNYTAISITGSGKIAFSNPHANGTIVIFKSQGNVTLTSSAAPMIDLIGIGAAAATSGYYGDGTNPGPGVTGGFGNGGSDQVGNGGGGGGGAVGAGGDGGRPLGTGTLGSGGVTTGMKAPTSIETYARGSKLATGGGGANGGTNGAAAGTGARGGGAMIIECGGAWNFTTASGISVQGLQGGTGSNSVSSGGAGGGGGSGGSGCFLALYNTLTANSGTVLYLGKTGGTPGSGGTYGPAGGGGLGGDGWYLIAKNTMYV